MGVKRTTGPVEWSEYPTATRAYAYGGGYWEKTKGGWKWCTGDTFPQPGGDFNGIIEEPIDSMMDLKKRKKGVR